MKFFFSALVASFAVCAFGQGIQIGAPPQGAAITAGSTLTIEVDRPDTLTGSTEVSLVISLAACPNNTCPDPADFLGTTLYKGPYNPQFSANGGDHKPPHQNFTATVPANFAKGKASLSVIHLSLVGAGPFPLYETKTTTVTIN